MRRLAGLDDKLPVEDGGISAFTLVPQYSAPTGTLAAAVLVGSGAFAAAAVEAAVGTGSDGPSNAGSVMTWLNRREATCALCQLASVS